jgi:hypothetical protein
MHGSKCCTDECTVVYPPSHAKEVLQGDISGGSLTVSIGEWHHCRAGLWKASDNLLTAGRNVDSSGLMAAGSWLPAVQFIVY